MKSPTKKQMQNLFNLSETIIKQKPWELLSDSQIIFLNENDPEKNVYINILGNAKQTYGLVTYIGDEAFRNFLLTIHSDELGLSSDFIFATQECLTTYFDKIESIPDIFYDQLEKYHPDYNPDFAAHFVSFYPSYFPATLNHDEAIKLADVFNKLIDVFPQIEAKKANNTLMITCTKNKDKWDIDYQGDYNDGFCLPTVVLDKSLFKGCKNNNEEWELDFNVLPIDISETENGVPIMAGLTTVLRVEDGFAYSPTLLEEGDYAGDLIVTAVIKTIKNAGIPKTIYVNNILYKAILMEFKEKLGIDIVTVEKLHLTIEYIRQFKEAMNLNDINQKPSFLN